MDKKLQIKKAERFRELHHEPELLILPNIWDPAGARLLEHVGYPAVATASAAVAYSLGYDDGEVISFEMMLDTIRRIASSVDVPMSADIERGYADSTDGVAANVRAVIHAGAVGINIEDSFAEGGALRDTDAQCERIRAVRAAADAEGIPLVINARTDVWMNNPKAPAEAKVDEIIERARGYVDAGADCLYPITLSDPDILRSMHETLRVPLNVYFAPGAPSLQELRAAGVARVSVGPGLFKAVFGTMRTVVQGIKSGESWETLAPDALVTKDILRFVRKDRSK